MNWSQLKMSLFDFRFCFFCICNLDFSLKRLSTHWNTARQYVADVMQIWKSFYSLTSKYDRVFL